MSSTSERDTLKRDPVIQFSVSKQQRAQIHRMVRKWNWERGKASRSDVLRDIVMQHCKAYLTEQEQATLAQGIEERSYLVRVNPYEDADRFWSSAKRLAAKDAHFRGPYEQLLRTDHPVKVPESWLMLARRCPGFSAGPLLINRKIKTKREGMASVSALQVPEPIYRIVNLARQATGRSMAGYLRRCITHALAGKTKLPVPTSKQKPLPIVGELRQLNIILPEETVTRWNQATRHWLMPRNRAMALCIFQAMANESVLSPEHRRLVAGYVSHLASFQQSERLGKNQAFRLPDEVVTIIQTRWVSSGRNLSSFVRHALRKELATSGHPRIPTTKASPLALPATARIHARISENLFSPWVKTVERFGLPHQRLVVAYACETLLNECSLSSDERDLVSRYMACVVASLAHENTKKTYPQMAKATATKQLPRLERMTRSVA